MEILTSVQCACCAFPVEKQHHQERCNVHVASNHITRSQHVICNQKKTQVRHVYRDYFKQIKQNSVLQNWKATLNTRITTNHQNLPWVLCWRRSHLEARKCSPPGIEQALLMHITSCRVPKGPRFLVGCSSLIFSMSYSRCLEFHLHSLLKNSLTRVL